MAPNDLPRIILEYEDKIRLFFLRRAAQTEDVEDLTQNAILAIFEGFPRFRGKSSVSTWIYAVCRNTLSRHYYYRRRDLDLLERLKESPKKTYDREYIDLPLMLERLTPLYRKLYDEFYRKDRSVREIAENLEKPEGTVKYMLYDLRRQIKRFYS